MTDHETSVLSSRLRRLADDMAPPIDVVGQVRAARSRHSRQRRGRIALLAAAAATAAVVVGSVAAADLLSAGPQHGEVAVPSGTTPTPPAPTTPASPPAEEPTGPLTAWETRTFEGATFAVPPGARAADTVDTRPVTSMHEGPSLTWNGPLLGGDVYSEVQIMMIETYEGGLYPTDGGAWFTVTGADSAYGGIESHTESDGGGDPVATTSVWLYVLNGDRQFKVSALFPGGEVGTQMAEHLIASLTVTPATGDDGSDEHEQSTAWESLTLQDITFSVPPGSSAPAHRTDSTLIWYGPEVGDQATFITVDVLPLTAGQSVGDGYTPTTVPGADQAWVMTDHGTINPGRATFNVWMHDGGRNINLGGMLPLDAGSEQTMQRVIASIAVG